MFRLFPDAPPRVRGHPLPTLQGGADPVPDTGHPAQVRTHVHLQGGPQDGRVHKDTAIPNSTGMMKKLKFMVKLIYRHDFKMQNI